MDDSRQLLEDASNGDPRAIDALLEHHLPALRAYVRLRMGPELRRKESCSDLVQSACREVLQHQERFQYQGEENFKRWLYTTALRKVKNRLEYYRAGKRDVGRELDGGGAESGARDDLLARYYQTLSTPSRQLMRQELIDRLESAFDSLPDDYREVITLSRIVGLPHKEIAGIMGRSEVATRSLLHRALAELAVLLDRPASGTSD